MGYILLIILVFILLYVRKLNKFTKNPYHLEIFSGSKGSGKSLLASVEANRFIGRIWSNMGIGFELPEKYWLETYPPDSLILIDEAGIVHGNRDFKTFPRGAIEFYKNLRKNRLHAILISQTLDIDCKIRDTADALVVCKRCGIFCIARNYKATVGLVKKPDGTAELLPTVKRAGIYRIFTYVKAIHETRDTGYRTEQIIHREDGENNVSTG